jgi:hypothetical protein
VYSISDEPQPIRMLYKNHRGVTRVRLVLPNSLWYGKTQYHPDNQWFMEAKDLEDNMYVKDFSIKDILVFDWNSDEEVQN